MKDKDRTKEQLIKELIKIRKKIDKLESVKPVHESRKDLLDNNIALKISENKYRKLLNNLECGVVVYEAINNGNDFIFKDINKAVEKVEKIKKREIIGHSLKKVFPGVVEFGLFDVFNRVYKTGKSQEHPVTLYKDGRIIGWRENHVYKLPTGEIVAVYRDMSKEKQKEERLEHLHRNLSTIRNINQLIIKEKNKAKLIKDACKTFIKERGYHSAWIVLIDEKGKPGETAEAGAVKDFRTLVERIKKNRFTACWEKAMSSSTIIINKDPKKDCGDCPLSGDYGDRGTMTVKLEHYKKVYGILSVSTFIGYIGDKEEQSLFAEAAGDISFALHLLEQEEKQKEAAKKLKESEDKYRSLYLSMAEGVCLHEIIYDKRRRPVDYRILDVNNAYEEIIGLKRDQAIGKKATEAYGVSNAPYIDIYEKVARTGKPKKFEVFFAPFNKYFEIFAFSYKKGKFATVFSDVTERIKAGKQISESYRKLQKTLDSIMDTLTGIIEIRDPYTAGHQKRVAALAIAISKELNLKEDRIEALSTAAIIHDIGKINIPASILAKPGKLSDIEFEMIKTHPQLGCDMLKNIDFPWSINDIIIQHHERLDGSGYPNGLRNKEISLEGRILAVADTVEAMSSHRPYRSAPGIKKALREIKTNSGKFYDAQVVDVCIELFNKKKFKFD